MNHTKNICEVPQEEMNDYTSFIAEKDNRLVKVEWNSIMQKIGITAAGFQNQEREW